MRIQLEPGGAHEVASTWLPMALRAGLMSSIDELAVSLALEGVAAALLGQLAYYYALQLEEVGRVTPLAAAFPLVASALAVLLFGETVTPAKLAGAVLVVAGVVLLKN